MLRTSSAPVLPGLLLSIISLSEIIRAEGSHPVQFPGAIPSYEGELSPSIRTGYTCEGEELMIQCDKDQQIQIIRANFGRFSIAICNDDGKTHWSVNCMSPKTRHILQNKCDNHNSCSVPVSSDLFGDPCPGTHKYVEIHYTCSSSSSDAETRRPLPPWYLQQPSLHSNSEFWSQPQIPSSDVHHNIVNNTDVGNYQNNYNSRIPILVATTTSPPRRVPITTPKPTTTTMASTTTTTLAGNNATVEVPVDNEVTSKEVDVLLQQTNEVVINHKSEYEAEPETVLTEVAIEDDVDSTIIKTFIKDEDEDNVEDVELLDDDDIEDYCPPVTARNLFWKMTKGGQMMIQPCPNGATGLARWQCVEGGSRHGARWVSDQPDMSDCKSVMMTNLEVKVRQEDPENVIASSLARLTGSRQLYGGDLQSAVSVMRTVASRIQYLLQQKSDNFYKKEAFIQEVLLNVVRSASNLLDIKNREAWTDLEVVTQMKVASSLLMAVEENAFLFAEVTNKPEILMESSYNILMAISVLNMKDIRNGTSFPLNNYEEPFGTIEDSIFLPLRALERSARDKLVKAVFFSFNHLDEILSRSDRMTTTPIYSSLPHQILNSRVISANVVGRTRSQLPVSVTVSLKHIREEGMGNPVCVHWDLDTSSWSRDGCEVVDSNKTRTLCHCDHMAVFALLMEEQGVPIVIHLPDAYVEIIVGCVVLVFLLILFIVVFKFRERVQNVLKIPCSKEKKKGLENCHKSQSFFNGINLMQAGPGGDKSQTLSTNMAAVTAAESQARLSSYVLSTGAYPEGEKYENIPSHRYEDISGSDSITSNQATLPLRARISNGQTHITINPYNTNSQMMIPGQHIYQVAMTPQLTSLTNTLRKKKCVIGHSHTGASPGPHSQSDSSVRSDSLTLGEVETDTEIIPHSSDVVFRAVSPHGHVYWEIDPQRATKLSRSAAVGSDEDTHNDVTNMSDFSEDDGIRAAASDRSRGSSSRFSDHRPLLSSSSPSHQMTPLPELVSGATSPYSYHSASPTYRFTSLQKGVTVNGPSQSQFSTRTRLGRPQQRLLRPEPEPGVTSDVRLTEQLQQQVQIPDLRRIPVSVKSSEYILAKIQNHMDQSNQKNNKTKLRNYSQERQV